MTYPIRQIDESAWPAMCRVADEAFSWTPAPGQSARYKAQTEFDRSLAAFDGEEMIGHTSSYGFTMTVPGARVPVAGVTWVGVLPSHRRRGVLSSLMRAQLADLRDRGEHVAALYASESSIYGRYGYGRASSHLLFRIDKPGSAFVRGWPQDPALRIRVVKPADVRSDIEKLFASVVARRPGRYDHNAAFWDNVLGDEDFDQHGAGPLRGLLAEDDGGVRGYALFRVQQKWTSDGISDGELRLHGVEATDPAAYALLWRSLLDRDLVSQVVAYGRPVDDPIIALLADQRRLRVGMKDELWVRLVDVDRALASRAYTTPVDLVIEVEDDVCPWNAGRHRLTGGPSGATCEPVDDAPDITLPVAALGSAYLGDGQLDEHLAAGLLREHSPGAVRALAVAMSWGPKPWCGSGF